MKRPVLALVGALTLGACAGDKLTLFENEDGNATGAVAVIDEKTGADKMVVDTALTEAKLGNRPKSRAVKQIKPAYTELLGSLPPKATPFRFTFEKDKFDIPADQLGILAEIRKELSRPGAQIEVVGFTDSTGDEELNNIISKGRAKSVADALRKEGFQIDADDEVGRGMYEALKQNGKNVSDESFRTVIVIIR